MFYESDLKRLEADDIKSLSTDDLNAIVTSDAFHSARRRDAMNEITRRRPARVPYVSRRPE